jgi:RNA polymerase sigma-70 factor (ECF subfamily)
VQQALRRERFRLIYEANYTRILAYALRRTASPEDAADIVSETFATAWRRLDDLPAGDETPLCLYGAARRLLANHRRQEHQRGRLKEMLPRPENWAQSDLSRGRLRAANKRVPWRARVHHA